MKASFTYAKPSTGNQPGETIVETTDSPAPGDANLQNGFKPNVPTDTDGYCETGERELRPGKYHAAEREYQELLTRARTIFTLFRISELFTSGRAS